VLDKPLAQFLSFAWRSPRLRLGCSTVWQLSANGFA
jgi:hypothetical protein